MLVSVLMRRGGLESPAFKRYIGSGSAEFQSARKIRDKSNATTPVTGIVQRPSWFFSRPGNSFFLNLLHLEGVRLRQSWANSRHRRSRPVFRHCLSKSLLSKTKVMGEEIPRRH